MTGIFFAVATVLALVLAWLPVETTIGTFLYEDMFYYLTLAEHAVNGLGVSFDGTTATNGLHPLWMLLCLSLALQFDGDALVHAVLTVAALLHVAQGWVLWDLLRRHASRPIAFATAGFWLFNYRVLASNLCGLETPLATFAALVVLRLLVDARAQKHLGSGLTLGLALGAAIASRFDLLLLGVVALAWVALDPRLVPSLRRRAATVLFAGAVAALVLVPWFAWSLGQSGTLLPNSREAVGLIHDVHYNWRQPGSALAVLAQQLVDGAWWSAHTANLVGAWPLPMPGLTAPSPAYWVGVALLFLLLLSVLPLGSFYARREASTRLAIPFLAYAALHTAWYTLFVEPEIRYLMPALAAGFAGTGLVAHAVLQTNRTRWLRAAMIGTVALLFVNATTSGILAWRIGHGTTFTHRYHLLLLEAARHLEKNTAPETVVGAWNAGILGYYSGRTVVNLDGVVNDDALEALRDQQLMAYVRTRDIDLIVDMPFQFQFFLSRFAGDETWDTQLRPLGRSFEDDAGRRVVAMRVLPPPRGAIRRAQPPPQNR